MVQEAIGLSWLKRSLRGGHGIPSSPLTWKFHKDWKHLSRLRGLRELGTQAWQLTQHHHSLPAFLLYFLYISAGQRNKLFYGIKVLKGDSLQSRSLSGRSVMMNVFPWPANFGCHNSQNILLQLQECFGLDWTMAGCIVHDRRYYLLDSEQALEWIYLHFIWMRSENESEERQVLSALKLWTAWHRLPQLIGFSKSKGFWNWVCHCLLQPDIAEG